MAEEESEYYGYFYGEEDKGLLDPAWERQQKKVRNSSSNLRFEPSSPSHYIYRGVYHFLKY